MPTPTRLHGYAATWNTPADIGGHFTEVMTPGVFSESLRRDDQRALYQHDPSKLLGRRSAGTLRLEEDSRGLRVEITPPDTPTGKEATENVRLRNLSGMSFSFVTREDRWSKEPGTGRLRREVIQARLAEVSIVTWPAYESTSIKAESPHPLAGPQAASDQRDLAYQEAERERLKIKTEEGVF